MSTQPEPNTSNKQFDEKGPLQPEANGHTIYTLPPDLTPEERSAYRTISRANEQMEQPIHRAKPSAAAAKGKIKTSEKARAKATRRRKASNRRDEPVALTPHQARCSICFHQDRDEIEESFLHWHSPRDIAYDFGVSERAIYRHAHALKLSEQRRRNLRYALGHIIDRVDRIPVMTPESIIRAVQLFARINDDGQLVEQPKQLIVSQGSPMATRIENSVEPSGNLVAAGPAAPGANHLGSPNLPTASVGNCIPDPAPKPEEKILVHRSWAAPIFIEPSKLDQLCQPPR